MQNNYSTFKSKNSLIVPITELQKKIKYTSSQGEQITTTQEDIIQINRAHCISSLQSQNQVSSFSSGAYVDFFIQPSDVGLVEVNLKIFLF